MPARIAVLLHERDQKFTSRRSFVQLLAEEWRAEGLEVELVWGLRPEIRADVLFAHLDLTVVPESYRRFLERFPVVVNRNCLDISKSRISRNTLSQGERYAHPVIVKTDLNCGGKSEGRLGLKKKGLVGRMAEATSRFLRSPQDAPEWMEGLQSHGYPIFPDLGSVPPAVFKNRSLVVEKFIPERDGDDYCLRYYYFLGDRAENRLLRSREPIVKGRSVYAAEPIPVTDAIRQVQAELGLDYGKLDYVMQDGRVELLDVSRTPAYTSPEYARPIARELAAGIHRFL